MGLSSAQHQALSAAECEIAFDSLTRQLYATDASLYQIEPAGVAFPAGADQASRLLRRVAEAGLSVIPRGAGTGLVGGALGDGLIIDFARHNQRIAALDLERGTVRVGAGVVLDELNAFLRPHGFCFGPDVATSSRATLGGMIANNSSGARVPVYGTTADHVEALEIVLADGQVKRVGRETPALRAQAELAKALVTGQSREIDERMPAGLAKRWPGYGLARCLRRGGSLLDILSGSEGTLAGILSAELRVVPIPAEKGLAIIFFESVAEAMQATVALLDLKPAAIEHIDRVLFDQTKGQLAFSAARALLDLEARPCASILLVEFYDEVGGKLAEVQRRKLGRRTLVLQSSAEMALVWALRKAGLSLLTGCKGAAKPVTGIEDTAVRPEVLPEYVRALEQLFSRLGVEACFYGHAATGLLHVRPVLDLHRAEDAGKFRRIADETSAIVRQFKGSLAAEHGVGIARTEFMADHLGLELLEVHRQIKRSFDPDNRFNPGKIIPDGRYKIDQQLRLGAGYRLELPFSPILAFAAKDDSFVGNLEQCNGCGGCRKLAPTMCPTYAATGEESMSTRGRANVIRALFEGRFGRGEWWRSRELEGALNHCLSCKACTTECPSNVNMALLKAELIHARHQAEGVPWRARVLSSVDFLGRLGTVFPGLANSLVRWPIFRPLVDQALSLDSARALPEFAADRFDWAFARRPKVEGWRGRVWLWDDTFVRYYEPEIGHAAVRVLEAAGFTVELLGGRRCCGRPAFSQGYLDKAIELGRHNLALLNGPCADDPVLFLEPSCYSMFIEDYRELKLTGAERARDRCFLFEQFIDRLLEGEPDALRFTKRHERWAIHGHCHAKALTNLRYFPRLAQRLPGREARILDTGCCGMAGAFGMSAEHAELSRQIAEPLLDQLQRQPPGAVVIATGTSCRHQIRDLSAVRPRHIAEVLAGALA